MKVLIIVAALCVAALAIPMRHPQRDLNDMKCGMSQIPTDRIVGGSTAAYGEFPYIISLRFLRAGQDFHTCGGSIIDDQWILTAAHCFLNSKRPESYKVRVGTYNQTAGSSEPMAKEYEVEKLLPHEDFKMLVKIQNDIALIKLKEKIDFSSDYVNRVCLPEAGELGDVAGSTLNLAGWGDTVNGNGQSIPQLLKKTQLQGLENKECSDRWGAFMFDDDQMLCAEEDDTSPCVGDSGGPLSVHDGIRHSQVGVVSFGDSTCAGPRPPVFTRVTNYLTWIKESMASN